MMVEWLQRRVSVEQVEAAHMVRHERLGTAPVAFGFDNGRWRELITQMQDGDELWEYTSPAETWANMAGRAGYALVREGKIVGQITTLMN
jgi:hypothetical protein